MSPQLPSTRGASALGLCRYEIVDELASGGMATVYLARCRGVAGFERAVAIKRLHPHLSRQRRFVDMFLDEARIAARIHHSNVVSTLDVGGDEESGYFLVMEYVAGRPLGSLLRAACNDGRRIGPRIIARIALDALCGLSAAHALTDDEGRPLGLVHRDVSPNNLIVGADGVTRVTDFGVAFSAGGRIASTEPGVIKGKLGYMSPEQAAGSPVDQRSDLFSMGVVLWESLAHRRLFHDPSPAATLHNLSHAPVPPLGAIDPTLAPLDPVVARALARDPAERFASAAAFSAALERAAAELGEALPARAVAQTVAWLAGDAVKSERCRLRNAPAVGVNDVFGRPATPPPKPLAAERADEDASAERRRAITRPLRKLPPLDSARDPSAGQPAPVALLPTRRSTPAPTRSRRSRAAAWQLGALALACSLLAGGNPALQPAVATAGPRVHTVVVLPELTVLGDEPAIRASSVTSGEHGERAEAAVTASGPKAAPEASARRKARSPARKRRGLRAR